MTRVPHACPPDHKHGATSTCYVSHKCRCLPCGFGQSERNRVRAMEQLAGTYDSGLVPAAPVREHLELLRASGLGWKRVARLSGIGETAVSQLIYGRKGSNSDPRKGETLKRVSRRTANAILAVQPSLELLGDNALVRAEPYARRLEALVAIGWSQSKLAAELQVQKVSNFRVIREYENDRDSTICASTARAIVALYDRLAMSKPPTSTKWDRIAHNRSITYASQRGWPLPMDWAAYDDDFDRTQAPQRSQRDPELASVDLDEVVVVLAMGGTRVRMTPAERREAIRRLHAQRMTDPEIAIALHMPTRSVFRIRGEELRLPRNVDASGALVERAAS